MTPAAPLSLPALLSALDSLSDGFALYDPDDRLVHANRRAIEEFSEIAELIVPGVRFEELMRALVSRGGVVDAIGREEGWIAERMANRHLHRGVAHLRRPGGRSLHVAESTTATAARRPSITTSPHCVSARTNCRRRAGC